MRRHGDTVDQVIVPLVDDGGLQIRLYDQKGKWLRLNNASGNTTAGFCSGFLCYRTVDWTEGATSYSREMAF